MSCFPKLKSPKLLCDENIPKKIVELLAKEGLDAKKAPFGFSNGKVIKLAKSEHRLLLTFDKHFGNTLLFPPEKYSGIIFIRIHPPLIKTVLGALLNLFKSVDLSEFKGRLFIVSPSGFRVFPRRVFSK